MGASLRKLVVVGSDELCFRSGLEFAFEYIEAEDRQTNYVDIGPVNKCMNMLSVFFHRGGSSMEFRRHAARLADYLWLAEDGAWSHVLYLFCLGLGSVFGCVCALRCTLQAV